MAGHLVEIVLRHAPATTLAPPAVPRRVKCLVRIIDTDSANGVVDLARQVFVTVAIFVRLKVTKNPMLTTLYLERDPVEETGLDDNPV